MKCCLKKQKQTGPNGWRESGLPQNPIWCVTTENLETVTVRKAAGISQRPLSSKSIHTAGRGSQHLANSTIPEVQRAALSRGECNPFIHSYVFVFGILCVTYTPPVCFESCSVSAQTPLFALPKQSEGSLVWLGMTGEGFGSSRYGGPQWQV